MISSQPGDTRSARKIIFITGTDTGVGKTLLAGLLLVHLRQSGCHALAMKPFCCGSPADVNFLRALQDGELSSEEISPFRFPEPLAPLVAARLHRRWIKLEDAAARIQQVATRCDRLIVEGCGGALVPLGEGFSVADLIVKLDSETIVVARNRLGTINHTLLTVRALQQIDAKAVRVVLMNGRKADLSCRSNPLILWRLLAPVKLYSLPFLGPNSKAPEAVKKNRKKLKKTLARLVGADNLCGVLSETDEQAAGKKRNC
jgi:dethiobiotin synthetase